MTISPESILSSFPKHQSTNIGDLLERSDFNGCFPELAQTENLNPEQLLPLASAFSIAPVSGFHVGAIAIGPSGHGYIGANMEFVGMPLNASLHAEQSAILNAWMHGEPSIEAIYISALPCGHCRQFMCELPKRDQISIIIEGKTHMLQDLLPQPFGEARRPGESLLGNHHNPITGLSANEDALSQRAINAAERSYVPYSNTPEGFAIECADGHAYAGRAAESVAFNPSVPAVLCALNLKNLSASRSYSINRCVQTKLVTGLNSSTDFTRAVLKAISNANLETVSIEKG
ncbi:MAG: cytidine deaminase [Verrucomicrobiota bacterium]